MGLKEFKYIAHNLLKIFNSFLLIWKSAIHDN